MRGGLPRIPSNVLSARLKELEASGVIRRRLLPRPESGFVYELTDYGRDLDEAVGAFGRWGARSLGQPRPGEIVTPNSMTAAFRATFQPQAACRLSATYELHMGELVLHLCIEDGALEVGQGPLPGADVTIEAGPGIRALMAGEVSPAVALESGLVQVSGDRALFDRFVELFRIEPAPAPAMVE